MKYLISFLFALYLVPAFSAEKVIDGANMIKYLKVIEAENEGLVLKRGKYVVNGLVVYAKAARDGKVPESRLHYEKIIGSEGEELPFQYEYQSLKKKNAYQVFMELDKNRLPRSPLGDFERRNKYVQKISIERMNCDVRTATCLIRW